MKLITIQMNLIRNLKNQNEKRPRVVVLKIVPKMPRQSRDGKKENDFTMKISNVKRYD